MNVADIVVIDRGEVWHSMNEIPLCTNMDTKDSPYSYSTMCTPTLYYRSLFLFSASFQQCCGCLITVSFIHSIQWTRVNEKTRALLVAQSSTLENRSH